MDPETQSSTQKNLPGVSDGTFKLIEPALEAVKRNWQAFVVVNILLVLSTITSIIGSFRAADGPESVDNFFGQAGRAPFGIDSSFSGGDVATIIGVVLVVALVFILVSAFFQAMATKLQLEAARGAQPSISSLFGPGKKYMLRLILLGFVSGIIIFFGLVLLIVPGIIAIGRLSMAAYHMVDKDLSVSEALRASNEQAKQVGIGKIWGPIGVVVALSFAASIVEGFIPIVGPIIALAVYIIMSMILPFRYQQLRTSSQEPASQDDTFVQPASSEPIA